MGSHMLPLKPTPVAGREDWGARGVGGQPDLSASPPCVLTVPGLYREQITLPDLWIPAWLGPAAIYSLST